MAWSNKLIIEQTWKNLDESSVSADGNVYVHLVRIEQIICFSTDTNTDMNRGCTIKDWDHVGHPKTSYEEVFTLMRA